MDGSLELGALALVALLTGLAGLAVPRLIARVPEPAPEEVSTDAVVSTSSTDAVVSTSSTDGDGAETVEIADEPPKILYADVAARPRLALISGTVSLAAAALVAWGVGWEWPLVYLLPLVPLLVALSVIDFATRLLPTVLMWPCYVIAIAGVLLTWAVTGETADLVRAGAGWLIAGLVFFVLWFAYPRGMGYGDVRLSGVLGIALGSLGWGELWIGLYSSFLVFGVPGLVLALVRRDRTLLKAAYPFGPFMVVGALIGVLWGEPLWTGLIGG